MQALWGPQDLFSAEELYSCTTGDSISTHLVANRTNITRRGVYK